MFWDLIFLVQYLQAGEPDMGLRTVISMGDSLHCNYFQFVCLPLRDIGLDYIASLPLQTISLYFLLCVFHCTSFLVGSVFFSIDGYSANGCDFDVPIRGGELRVLLFCHVGQFCGKCFLSYFFLGSSKHGCFCLLLEDSRKDLTRESC